METGERGVGRDPVRFGIEEEFVLLDDATLAPLAQGHGERERITGSGSGLPSGPERRRGGEVVPEYLTCQVECITDPLRTAEEAARQLRRLRGLAHEYAAGSGAVLAPSGTPFVSSGGFTVSPSPHYDQVADHLAEITRDHEVNGLHVHIEVADDEERVRALRRLRVWLPALLALTANSPFAHGRHSGFESWRSILIRRLPSSWCPPPFPDHDSYQAGVERLIALGAIPDASSLAWGVRLSERFPTIEARIFDTQLTAEESLAAALLTRAVVVTDDLPDIGVGTDMVDAAMWTAAKHGSRARVLDPLDGRIAALRDVIPGMLDRLSPTLAAQGGEDLVTESVSRVVSEGTGSERQARAYASEGIRGLRELYRRSATR